MELLEDRTLLDAGPCLGPDAFGYRACAVPFENIDLQTSQPGVFTILQQGDEETVPVDLGSNRLNLYGNVYTGNNQLYISANGLITLGGGDPSSRNTDLTSSPNLPTIAPLWSDWFKNSPPGNPPMILGKFEDTNSDGISNRLIIEWNNVRGWRDFYSPGITFEAVLQLNTGGNTASITFNYTTLNPASASISTVGIKDNGFQGPNRLLVSANAASPFVGSGQAIQITAPPFGNTISGQLFNDLNRNGVKDPGEPGLAGWTVYLDLNRNGIRDPNEPSTVTDVNGNYTFSNVPRGSYLVSEELPPGWTRTAPSGAFAPPAAGPDGFGYGAVSTAFENIHLQAGQPGVFTAVYYADDVSVPVDLGNNTFNFYGTTYTGNNQLYVSSNGLITFGGPDIAWVNGDLTSVPSLPAIAPLWSDWVKSSGTPMILGKLEDSKGDGVPDRLILQWDAVQTHPSSPVPLTFQAILQLNTGYNTSSITFNYVNLNAGNPAVNNGASATVGIKDATGQTSNRLLVSMNNGSNSLLGSGKAIRITTATGGSYGLAVGVRQVAGGNDFGNFQALAAVDDAYSVNENQTLTVAAPGVLANDSNFVQGTTLSAILVSDVSHGSLSLNGDGSFTYTPAAGFFGTDHFTYKANNGQDSNVATVTITVNQASSFKAMIQGPADGVRGQDRVYTVSVVSDSAVDLSTVFRYVIDWNGDGSAEETLDGPSGLQVHHVFTESGEYPVHMTVTDLSSGVSADTILTVSVTAVALQEDPLNPGKTALVVGGTLGDDKIRFLPGCRHGTVRVWMNGEWLGTYAPTSRIIAFGQAGDDDIEVSDRIKLPAWLYGGDGNDRLKGGGGFSVLVGGEGNNTLIAGLGRSLLIGGHGAGRLVSRGGEDILIAGTTAFDGNEAALFAIMREWTSRHDHATRLANLSGTGSGKSYDHRLNGNYFLRAKGPEATVFHDEFVNVIYQHLRRDWIFADDGDIVLHKRRCHKW